MPVPPRTISITEDDAAVQEGIQLILERSGYRTVVCHPRLLIEQQCDFPDLYIIDRQLSGIDGLDLCRVLKSNPETHSIPVIIVSATPHVARLSELAGANGFLEKPFRASALLEIVGRHFTA